MSDAVKVCVIGAGVGGLVTAKALKDRSVDFDCFEREAEIGGVWHYKDAADRFSIYKSCHTIASKSFMALDDLPMSPGYRDYMPNQEFMAYINEYADRFALRGHIQFGSEVVDVAPSGGGRWSVEVRRGDRVTRSDYNGVIVANGLFHSPKYPSYRDDYKGEAIHSAYYRVPNSYAGKDVLVVGLGNSGVDIANDLVPHARSVTISSRRGAHVFPKFILGRPFLSYYQPFDDFLPFSVRQAMTTFLMWIGRGPQGLYGFPQPKDRILLKNPVVSSHLLEQVACGDILMKSGVQGADAGALRFEDGSIGRYDAVIYATGYQITFPFFKRDVLTFEAGSFLNYKNVVNLNHDNLYFVGLVDPLGTLPPLLEQQAKWVAALLANPGALPSKEGMRRDARAQDAKIRKRFKKDDSPYPAISVDFYRYRDQLRRLIKQAAGASTA